MDTNKIAKDPQDWKSGDDPATPAQESYLNTLADQTGEDIPDGMTKAAASEKIDELRGKAGLDGQQVVTPDIPVGDRLPTETIDDDVDNSSGNGEEPYRMTPVSPNANR